MTSTLLGQLQTRHGYPLLDADSYDHFVYGNETVVLFFCNDPAQFPESSDVAVILPELLKAFNGRLQAAVIATHRARIAGGFLYRLTVARVLRNGEYLGVISGVKNWREFSETHLAARPANRPDSIG
jgi:hydrogenase-1 operon protein HyaE